MCVLILLYMCPHTAVYVSSYCCMCVLILLYVCPHTAVYTAVYLSSYCYKCVLILLYVNRPQIAGYVSFCYISVLILLYICLHTTTSASSGLNRNGRHASYSVCAATHTCDPCLSTLLLQAATWESPVRHAWRVLGLESLCPPPPQTNLEKQIFQSALALTHSPPQVC
jgi:hypothetical protein